MRFQSTARKPWRRFCSPAVFLRAADAVTTTISAATTPFKRPKVVVTAVVAPLIDGRPACPLVCEKVQMIQARGAVRTRVPLFC